MATIIRKIKHKQEQLRWYRTYVSGLAEQRGEWRQKNERSQTSVLFTPFRDGFSFSAGYSWPASRTGFPVSLVAMAAYRLGAISIISGLVQYHAPELGHSAGTTLSGRRPHRARRCFPPGFSHCVRQFLSAQESPSIGGLW